MVEIGKRNLLSVVREAPPGLYLDGQELGEILLPRRYVTPQFIEGQIIDVFVYLDSEDRLVATTETPHAMVGQFAFLNVVALNPNIGAFLDWGLSKDLLLPFREQEAPLRIGGGVLVAVCLDEKSNRIMASMRLRRHLTRGTPPFRTGDAVQIIISRQTDIGFEAIVEHSHLGLLYRDNLFAPIQVGQEGTAYIRTIRPDGKIDLSLNQTGYKRVGSLETQILEALQESQGKLDLDDDSAPDAIRGRFGVSKKAWKQALGGLYKQRKINFTHPGIELIK